VVKDLVKREQIALDCWEFLKKAVDEVLHKNGNIRDTEKWQECFSEACLGFVQGLNSYEEGSAKPSTYCIHCAKNQVRTWLRKTNRWRQHESSWETKFVSSELTALNDSFTKHAQPEDVYGGSQYNTINCTLPMSYLRWWNDPDMASPEKEYLFAEKVHAARKILAPLYARWDKIDRGIFNKVIIALVPERQYILAKYYKMSQAAISRRIVKLRQILRQEDL
jgi:RNA polymerase sigma factor (sigma-70 family)